MAETSTEKSPLTYLNLLFQKSCNIYLLYTPYILSVVTVLISTWIFGFQDSKHDLLVQTKTMPLWTSQSGRIPLIKENLSADWKATSISFNSKTLPLSFLTSEGTSRSGPDLQNQVWMCSVGTT